MLGLAKCYDEILKPAMALLYEGEHQSRGYLESKSKLLQINFLKISTIKAHHRKDCCAYLRDRICHSKPITPAIVLKTAFFKNIQCTQKSPLHDKIKSIMVPLLNFPKVSVTQSDQEKVNEWLTCFLESSRSFLNHFEFYESQINREKSARTELAKISLLVQAHLEKENILTENDLNVLIERISIPSQPYLIHPDNPVADNPELVAEFTKKYLDIFTSVNTWPDNLPGIYLQGLLKMTLASLEDIKGKFFPPKLMEMSAGEAEVQRSEENVQQTVTLHLESKVQ